MIRLIPLLLLLGNPLSAQVVTVKTGEHGSFTRLVLNLPRPGEWRLGRTDDGYELEITDTQPNFDLSDVYRLITNDRLRSIWADPQTGRLNLGIGCACHAIPFEFGPRNLVIDIRQGDPPAGSAFESPLAGGLALSALGAVDASRPKPRPDPQPSPPEQPVYSWIDTRKSAVAARPPPMAFAAETLAPHVDVEVEQGAFRTLLTEQIAKGATQGVVELTLGTPPSPQDVGAAEPKQARVAMTSLPGLSLHERGSSDALRTDGQDCPKPDRLNLRDWSPSEDASREMSAAKTNLIAEFDAPQSAQLTAAVQRHLYFGFGAEARNLLRNIAPNHEADPFLVAMSYLIDSEPSPSNPFVRMQSCNSNAALWALLAAPDDQPLDGLNGAAVARSALELPNHLSSLLAPRIVSRLHKEGDPTNAEVVQNALSRVTAEGDPSVQLLDAQIALTQNKPDEAEVLLDALTQGATTLDGLFARVEARFQQEAAVAPADVLALEAFAFEQRSGTHEAAFQRALSHAYALSGAFDMAFGEAQGERSLELDVWNTLAKSGRDSDILTFAVPLSPHNRAVLPKETRVRFAERLLGLGLPNVANEFLDVADDPALVARVGLANGDGRGAIRALSASINDPDPTLLAKAYEGLGDYDASAKVWRESGNFEDAARADRWQGKWSESKDGPTDAWKSLATLAADDGGASALPPLRAAQENVERSASTRASIEALLQTVPGLP